MLRLIDHQNRADHAELLRAMHRDRKRLFVDFMRWNLPCHDGEERDDYDDDDAEYLILEGRPGEHIASLRFLRTDRPHLLDSIFPHLCDRSIPCGPKVREITRLCLPLRRCAPERIAARNILARAIVDYGLTAGISSYTAVCNIGFLSELLSAGWRCDPLGLPQDVEGQLAGALQIHIDAMTLGLLAENWRCDPAGPRLIHFAAAA